MQLVCSTDVRTTGGGFQCPGCGPKGCNPAKVPLLDRARRGFSVLDADRRDATRLNPMATALQKGFQCPGCGPKGCNRGKLKGRETVTTFQCPGCGPKGCNLSLVSEKYSGR